MSDIRQRLIDATFEEVYTKGYHAASLSCILKTAQAKKGSMYHYFSSKKHMVLEMIKEKVQKQNKNFWIELDSCEDNIISSLILILKNTSNRDFANGCPLANLLQECSSDEKDFLELLNSIFSDWDKLFQEALKKAINNNEIRDVDVKSTSLFLIATIEGAILLSKRSASSYEYNICINQLELYLNSLKN